MRWLRHLARPHPRPDESVAWEIEHHLSEMVDGLVAEGVDREEAERLALARFGDRHRYGLPMKRIERTRMVRERLGRMWDACIATVTSTVRTARRHPAYAAGVVVTLGLGLGANATMYGIVDRLLLRPPEHVVQPEQVRNVFLNRPNPVTGTVTAQAALSYPDYEDLKAHSRMTVAAYNRGGVATVGTGAGATRAHTAETTASFFPLLGVRPHLGRFYTQEEARPGSPVTAVLSYELWERVYGSDPDILGRVIQIDDDRVPVIGVTPPGFTGVGLAPIDILMPLEASVVRRAGEASFRGRGYFFLQAVARLDEGVDVESAEEEATRLHQDGRREEVEAGRYSDAVTVTLAPLHANSWEPEPSAESRVAGWLMGVSLVVLLIACANVANLLLARLTRTRREVAVRLALGISRRRLVARTIVEATALALLGGALALAIAHWGGEWARTTLLPEIVFPDSAASPRVAAFTAIVAALAGLFAGLGPALRGTRVDVAPDLTDSGRALTARRSLTRDALTAGQAALSVVLLVGAGLFVRSLMELRALDLGLDTDRIVWADFDFVGGRMEALARRDLFALAARRIEALPEVESVAGTATPFSTSYAISLHVPGLDSLPRFAAGGPYVFSVTPGYFRTTGLSIVRGRPILETDGPADEPVAVVGETMARALWPDEGPLGRCLMVGSDAQRCTTVVGVVEDASRGGFDQTAYMGYYLPVTQAAALIQGATLGAPNALYLRVRPDADVDAVVAAATPILRGLTPDVRWARVQSLRDTLDPQARSWTLGATMFIAFGLLAVSLAAIGLYAILAFDVAQRTRELGIRVALGAERGRLLRAVLYRGGRVAGAGIVTGLVVAYTAAPAVQELLFDVSPRDPAVLVSVSLVLIAVSVAASLVPGLRATRVDPMDALKAD